MKRLEFLENGEGNKYKKNKFSKNLSDFEVSFLFDLIVP